MIVVDVNILAYFSITGANTALAHQALRKDSDWVAPVLWRSEFENVLVNYLRQNLMTLGEATTIMASVEKRMHERQMEVKSSEAIEIAHANSITAYDAEYVALAKQNSVRLLTTDKEILKKFPEIAVSLQDFVGA